MHLFRRTASLIAVSVVLAACGNTPPVDESEQTTASATASGEVVEVTALDYVFAMPTEIPSGWVSFQMENRGEEIHELFLTRHRLPEGRTYADFREATDAYIRTGEFPEWMPGELTSSGGVGSISPRITGEATVYLDPGTYSIACHVPTAEGIPHYELGMVGSLMVTDEPSGGLRPTPEFEVRVSENGYHAETDIPSGEHTVQFATEGTTAEVVLFRLNAGKTAQDVEAWMADESQTPPGELLGGIEPLEDGADAFFTARFQPGQYAWAYTTFGATEEKTARAFTVR